jgi:outer membrane immunogenic protein
LPIHAKPAVAAHPRITAKPHTAGEGHHVGIRRAGYDWQFAPSWVFGIFGDGQFGSLRGSIVRPIAGVGAVEATEKLRDTWAAGVRLGYLVAPNVYSYVNAGYTGSEWSGAGFSSLAAAGGPVVFTTPSFHRDGWFIGGGVENSLNIFGISAPGWFMKTEYRSAFFDRITLPETLVATGRPDGIATTFKPWVQTILKRSVQRQANHPIGWVWNPV